MRYYGLYGTFVAQPGKESELMTLLLQAAKALESNQDCIHYIVGYTNEPGTISVAETWTTKEAHDASLASEAVKEAIAAARPLILSMPGHSEVSIEGGKGF